LKWPAGGRKKHNDSFDTGDETMLRALKLHKWLFSGVMALGLLGGFGAATPAKADCYQPAYVDVWVTVYERQLTSYPVCVTKYDHCGKPYHVYETRYKVVEVPVRKLVRVYR
jgi:hypothetical protein